jgi:hypothetical protein
MHLLLLLLVKRLVGLGLLGMLLLLGRLLELAEVT